MEYTMFEFIIDDLLIVNQNVCTKYDLSFVNVNVTVYNEKI